MNRESRSTHTRASSGSRETEVNEFAVMAWSMPSASVVTTAMPVA